MRKLVTYMLFCGLTMLVLATTIETPKSEIVALYNADSVMLKSERYKNDLSNAQGRLESSRRELKQNQDPKQQQATKNPGPDIKHDKNAPKVAERLDPKESKKRVIRDSIYLSDSVGPKAKQRISKNAEDFRRNFGYKLIMTTEEYKTYKMTSNGALSKTESVTEQLTNYLNSDSIVRRY